jgi:pimeloyl-ACP methyl ester carboxylesterase
MNRFVTPDGIGLAWQEEGEGLPILCLPGLTRDNADFDEFAAALGGRYRLIRLTFRGRGESDHDPNFLNYNPGTEAQDVVAFLDHLGLDRVTVVGTSRGGLVAMVLAAIARDRLAGVLFNDIGPEIAPGGLEVIMGYLGVPPKPQTFPEVAAALKARMGGAFPDLSDERWQVLARRWFRATPEGGIGLTYDAKLRDAVEAVSAQPAADLWPLFDAFDGIPIALVRGANSDLLTSATVAAMQERRPDMIVAEVPDRGHVPFLDEPAALAALEALMARVRTQPAAS